MRKSLWRPPCPGGDVGPAGTDSRCADPVEGPREPWARSEDTSNPTHLPLQPLWVEFCRSRGGVCYDTGQSRVFRTGTRHEGSEEGRTRV